MPEYIHIDHLESNRYQGRVADLDAQGRNVVGADGKIAVRETRNAPVERIVFACFGDEVWNAYRKALA